VTVFVQEQVFTQRHKRVEGCRGILECERGNSGADGGRTHNLRIANAALSQLSYSPNLSADRDGNQKVRSAGVLHQSSERIGKSLADGTVRQLGVSGRISAMALGLATLRSGDALVEVLC
jgi:hypothetical protein